MIFGNVSPTRRSSEANFLYILVDIDKKIIYYLINDIDNYYQLIDKYIK